MVQQVLPSPLDLSSSKTERDREAFVWLNPGDSFKKQIQLTIPSWMGQRPGSYEVGVTIAMEPRLYDHAPKDMPKSWPRNPNEKRYWPGVWVGKVMSNLVTIEVIDKITG